MTGVLFEYGTAAHLALLTVAPLFLSALGGTALQAIGICFLSISSAAWVVMSPSPRRDEWPRDARRRIGFELARDPFLTFCAVALVLSLAAAVNGGIAAVYVAAKGLWRLKEPAVSLLPGSVTGQGWLPLAGVLAFSVVTLGVRHALGSRARLAYLFSVSFFAALAVVLWRTLQVFDVNVPRLTFQLEDPVCLGTLLGVPFVFSIASWVECWAIRNPLLEFLSSICAAALLAGLILYAPSLSFWVFSLAAFLIVLTGVALSVVRRPPTAWVRTVVSLLVVLSPVILLVSEAISRPGLWPLFPEGFLSVRETATAVALAAWKDSSQLGVGLGAYPLALGFHASQADWQILPAFQSAVPNGWVQFLFERGFLGGAMLLIGFTLLLWDAVRRFVRAGKGWSPGVLHVLGLLVLSAVVGISFFGCSYVQIETLVPVGAALALTAAAFPEPSEENYG